jgi:hypothetical protein
MSNIYLLYPTASAAATLSFTRYGYSYSVGSFSYTLASQMSITSAISVSNIAMKGNADYSATFSLNYLNIDHFSLNFCNQFGLTGGQTYSCYLGITIPSNRLTCTATNATQLKVQLTNGSSF